MPRWALLTSDRVAPPDRLPLGVRSQHRPPRRAVAMAHRRPAPQPITRGTCSMRATSRPAATPANIASSSTRTRRSWTRRCWTASSATSATAGSSSRTCRPADTPRPRRDAWPICKAHGLLRHRHRPPRPRRPGPPVPAAAHGGRARKSSAATGTGVRDGNGLSLKKDLPECQDLLLWADGSVAAGIRRLGKGAVIHLGVKFAHDRGAGNADSTRPLMERHPPLGRRAPLPGHRHGRADEPLRQQQRPVRRLDDVERASQRRRRPILHSATALFPASYREVTGGQSEPVSLGGDARIRGLKFRPWETRVILTPRQQIAAAPLQWLKLQRNWWRGSADAGPPVPAVWSRKCRRSDR